MTHQMFRSPCLVLLLITQCVLAACSEEPRSDGPRNRTVTVTVARVEEASFERSIRGIGSLEGANQVVIRPERAGIVKEIRFQEGQMVQQGERLVTLRDDKLQQELKAQNATLQSALATLDRTRRSYQRFARLFEQDTISREELDQVQTAYETAQADVDRLRAQVDLVREQLADTSINAPVSGLLSESFVDPGDYVEEGDDLVTLYDTSTLEVVFSVSGNRVGSLEKGQPVTVFVDAFPETAFTGRVTFVGPAVDPATRTLPVKARVDNPGQRLKPGLFATAEVVIDSRISPAVPEQALVAVRTGYVVFTVGQNATASRQPVQIGLRRPGLVEILEGVAPGDRVVTLGHMNLSDGTPVEVVSDPENARPSPEGNATGQERVDP